MIDPQLIESFQRDGAACLRALFTPAEMALLTAGIEENLAHPSPRALVASRSDDPGPRRGPAEHQFLDSGGSREPRQHA